MSQLQINAIEVTSDSHKILIIEPVEGESTVGESLGYIKQKLGILDHKTEQRASPHPVITKRDKIDVKEDEEFGEFLKYLMQPERAHDFILLKINRLDN